MKPYVLWITIALSLLGCVPLRVYAEGTPHAKHAFYVTEVVLSRPGESYTVENGYFAALDTRAFRHVHDFIVDGVQMHWEDIKDRWQRDDPRFPSLVILRSGRSVGFVGKDNCPPIKLWIWQNWDTFQANTIAALDPRISTIERQLAGLPEMENRLRSETVKAVDTIPQKLLVAEATDAIELKILESVRKENEVLKAEIAKIRQEMETLRE